MFTPPAPMLDINGAYAGTAKPVGMTRLQRAFNGDGHARAFADLAAGVDPVSRPTFRSRIARMFGRASATGEATRANDQRGDYAPKGPVSSSFDPAPPATVGTRSGDLRGDYAPKGALAGDASATSQPIIDPSYWTGTR